MGKRKESEAVTVQKTEGDKMIKCDVVAWLGFQNRKKDISGKTGNIQIKT